MLEQFLNPAAISEYSPALIFAVFFFGTFISEDAACLAAGALVGRGEISFALAIAACFSGILVGDIGLYWIGRGAGAGLRGSKFAARFVSDDKLARASLWLGKRGASAIFLSRFVTGLRLPTYLAAGFLKTPFWQFAFYFAVAAAIWTPILVGATAFALASGFVTNLLAGVLIAFVTMRLTMHFASWRNRRLFAGRVKRWTNWEFWPLWLFYLPVVLYVARLAIRFRSLSVFADANPAILAGGFVGETKSEIYDGLRKSETAPLHLLKFAVLPNEPSGEERVAAGERFIEENDLRFPVALKPDSGERGAGVVLAANPAEFKSAIEAATSDLIIQEFAAGVEFSVFYFRRPNEPRGEIFSITEKRFPSVIGDGDSTLETLILKDKRAVALARIYFVQNAARLDDIPRNAEEVSLINIGTHSKGAIFLDGAWAQTEKIEVAIDRLCRGYEGFYFGRFDLRSETVDAFQNGDFKVIELNGVTSESTNIYDPKHSLAAAYGILFRQWKIAFEIGAENRRSGAPFPKTTTVGLVKLLFERWFGNAPAKSVKLMPTKGIDRDLGGINSSEVKRQCE